MGAGDNALLTPIIWSLNVAGDDSVAGAGVGIPLFCPPITAEERDGGVMGRSSVDGAPSSPSSPLPINSRGSTAVAIAAMSTGAALPPDEDDAAAFDSDDDSSVVLSRAAAAGILLLSLTGVCVVGVSASDAAWWWVPGVSGASRV